MTTALILLLLACGPADDKADAPADDTDAADTDPVDTDVVDTDPPDTDPPDTDDSDPPDTDVDPPAEDLDGDGAFTPADCDDADPTRYPGAPELCDGLDQDCVLASPETDSVFLPDVGLPVNVSAWFDAPTPPGPWTTPGPGVLQLCPGDHVGTAIIGHDDVTVQVLPGPANARLDGVTARAIDVMPGLRRVRIRDLDLSGADTDGGALRVGFDSAVVGDNLLFSGASADRGGAVFIDIIGTLTLTTAELSSNTANRGGAVYASEGSRLLVEQVTFEANAATDDGGAMWLGAGVILEGTAISWISNEAGGDGGGLAAEDATRITCVDCRLSGNTADGAGAGAHIVGVDDVDFTSLTAEDNTAGGDGGALAFENCTAQVQRSRFGTNHASRGGAFASEDSEVSVVLTEIDANDADLGGGAWISGGSVSTLSSGWFDNFARRGGGAWLTAGSLMIDGGAHGGNLATDAGGALWLESGVVDILNGAWSGGRATTGGFARVGAGGTLRLTDTDLMAQGADDGAVLWSSGTVSALDVTFHNNVAGAGASLLTLDGGAATFNRCDFGAGAADNSLPEVQTPAGDYSDAGSSVDLLCTLAGCTF